MSREDAPEIKPCPFCESEEVVETEDITNSTQYCRHVLCWVCYASGGFFETPNEAIRQWNRALRRQDNQNEHIQRRHDQNSRRNPS